MSNDCAIAWEVKTKLTTEPDSAWTSMPSWMAKSSTSRGDYGITVEEASTASFPEPVSYDVWINVLGSDSQSSAASANATFVLTMQNLCYETVITCTGTEEIADYRYTIPVD